MNESNRCEQDLNLFDADMNEIKLIKKIKTRRELRGRKVKGKEVLRPETGRERVCVRDCQNRLNKKRWGPVV